MTYLSKRKVEIDTEKSIKEFLEDFNSNKIKLDEAFQRKECWPLESKQNYIEGLWKGDFAGAFLLAVIPNQQRDIYETYFDKLETQGFEYISIDGNNRTVTLSEYCNNEFTVKLPNTANSLYFEELSDQDQKWFLKEIKIARVLYSGISQLECSEIFINHNESEKLKHQELRNANLFSISKYVRLLEKKLRPSISIFDTENRYRKNDEFILDVIAYQTNPFLPTNKKRRDLVWSLSDKQLSFDKKYLETTLKLLPEFLNKCDFGKKTSSSVARDFSILRGLIKRKSGTEFTQESFDIFLDILAEERTKLLQSDKVHTLNDGQSTRMTYTTICGLPINKAAFEIRVQLLEKLLDTILENSSDLKFKTVRSKLTQDVEVRRYLANKQDWKCSITNEFIKDYLDGDRWHVDHIIPLSKGGLDEVSNMRLIDASANLQKGSKLELVAE